MKRPRLFLLSFAIVAVAAALVMWISLRGSGALWGLISPADKGPPGALFPEPVYSQAAKKFGAFEYVNPLPGASLVSVGTSICLRSRKSVDASRLQPELFRIVGEKSGNHVVSLRLSDDGRTMICKPLLPFAKEEKVTVEVRSLADVVGQALDLPSFSFTTHAEKPEIPAFSESRSKEKREFEFTRLAYKTLPQDFPRITVNLPAQEGVAAGHLFLSNFSFRAAPRSPSYLMIVDNRGEPIFFQKLEEPGGDFKKQNGNLTYWDASGRLYRVLDPSYQVVDSWAAGNGYVADGHGFQLLANGHGLLMIYDLQYLDLRGLAAEGSARAIVAGLIVQELDRNKEVVFEWRSWDHLRLTDTNVDLSSDRVDYVHGNAVELDQDGNYLISSRHLDEITKVSRKNGEILWRFGGKKNQFRFLNDFPFVHQHDVRRLPNGNISLFDNRAPAADAFSRVLEYRLDEEQKTAQLVWQYRQSPDVFAPVAGNMQRLSNGNTLIGWGSAWPNVTEVTPDGRKVFELGLAKPEASYRAFRFPWIGEPVTRPSLVAERKDESLNLYFSWNGATEVHSYRLEGITGEGGWRTVASQQKSGFETSIKVDGFEAALTGYRVVALGKSGEVLATSQTVSPR